MNPSLLQLKPIPHLRDIMSLGRSVSVQGMTACHQFPDSLLFCQSDKVEDHRQCLFQESLSEKDCRQPGSVQRPKRHWLRLGLV